MRQSIFAVLLFCGSATGEIHRLTLYDSVDTAIRQNPEVILAHLDEQRAIQSVMIKKDPFYPKLFAGSGGAWTFGYPQTNDRWQCVGDCPGAGGDVAL